MTKLPVGCSARIEWRRPALVFAAFWLLQLALAVALPLVADEAYYQDWAQAPAWGYFDHPPGIGWWIWAGGGHPRLMGLLALPLAYVALADAGRRWGVRRWIWTPALLMATPLGFSAGLIATPDAPLLFVYCWVLWAVSTRRIGLAGVLFGLSLYAKGAALVAAPGLAWVVFFGAPSARAGLGRVLLAMTGAAAVYAPQLYWSAYNDWLPWSFQAGRRWDGFHGLELLGGQLALVGPVLFAVIFRAWLTRRDPTSRRLIALSAPVFLCYLAASLGTRIEANWPALAWPAAVLLALHAFDGFAKLGALSSGVLTLGAAATLPFLVWFAPIGKGPPRDPRRLTACYEAAADGLPLVAARYQERALLGPRALYARAVGHRRSQYDLWGTDPLPRSFLYLADGKALGDRCASKGAAERACGRRVVRCLSR